MRKLVHMSDATVIAMRGWRPAVAFPDRLRMVRRQFGDRVGRKVDQREMANLLGITQQSWARWESGQSTPRDLVPTVLQIAAVTGVDPDWLLGIDRYQPQPDPERGLPETAGGSRRSKSTICYSNLLKAA